VKAAIQSCLKQMEKLICLMCESHEKILQEDMKESIGFVLNTGLESVIEATMDKLIAYDALMDVLKIVWNLHVSFQISQSLAYKCKYKEYLFRLKKVPVPPTTLQSIEVDDEFDDQEMMNIFATVDIDNAISGASTKSSQNTSEQSWKDKEHHSTTISSFISSQLLSHLRVPLQRVLINFPSSIYEKEPAMEDVIVELFGLLLSSSSFTFHWSWSWLNTATGKNRSLGPRLLSVTLKNNPSWLRGYLNLDQIATKKESEAQEIATLWLEATLDIKTFTESKTTKTFHLKNLTKNSMYWWILTDSILYDLLQPDIHRESSCNMINLLIKTSEQTVHQLIQMGLLKDDAEMVAFSTLETYEMHRLWFKNFCTCVSQIWNDLKDSGARRNFRQNIMGDTFTRNKGVFAVLLQYVFSLPQKLIVYRYLFILLVDPMNRMLFIFVKN
jgi:hypothetical protein